MKASAPASSANLGPGFDAVALALDLRCQVTVEPGSRWEIADDPGGFLRAAAERISSDPLHVQVDSQIPVGKGLGSSAAVLAALEMAVARLHGEPDDRGRVFDAVTAAEGHPDNAAAAVYGGLVLADAGGVHHLEVHQSLSVLVAVPEETLPTEEARAVLPDTVPFGVAARTSGRAMRLVEGLRTGSLDLLADAGPDELHEPYRIGLRPVIGELMAAARSAGAAFVALSGAGPSVLALTTGETIGVVREAVESVGSTRVLLPGIDLAGIA